MTPTELTAAKFAVWKATVDDPRITRFDCRVIVRLVDLHHREKGYAWPNIKTLAKALGAPRKSVQRSLKRLEAMGWIEIKPSVGRGNANEYRLIWAMARVEIVAEKAACGPPFSDPEKAACESIKGVRAGTPFNGSEKASGWTPKRRPDDTLKGVRAGTPHSFEVNPIKTPRASEGDSLPSPALNKNQKDSLVGFSSTEIPNPPTESRSGIPNAETSLATIELFPGTSKIEFRAQKPELVATIPTQAAETKKSAGQGTNNDSGGEFDLADTEPEAPPWSSRAPRNLNGDEHPSGVSKYRFELRLQELEFNTTFPNLTDRDRKNSDFWMLSHPDETSEKALEKLRFAHEAEMKATMNRLERQQATKFGRV